MAAIDFRNAKDFEHWLADKPREWEIVLAARIALRIAPILLWPDKHWLRAELLQKEILLPLLRGMISTWLFARYLSQVDKKEGTASAYPALAPAAAAAAAAAGDAASAAFSTTSTSSSAAADAASIAAYTVLADAFTQPSSAAADAARAAASAATHSGVDADDAVMRAIALDARALAGVDGVPMLTPAALASAPLWSRSEWPDGAPDWLIPSISKFQHQLQLAPADEHWDVWLGWWLARFNGGNINNLHDAAAERVEVGILLLPEEVWELGPKVVNKAIKELIAAARAGEVFDPPATLDALNAVDGMQGRPPVTLSHLADLASPQPVLANGKLDAVPNRIFDSPLLDDDLVTLPIRQQTLIRDVLLPSLPGNAPPGLQLALKSYAHELATRGAQPILGLLADMRAIISADLHAQGPRLQWLSEGLTQAFDRFESNDGLLQSHFPLDAEREEIYATTPVNEEAATGEAFSKCFNELNDATKQANRAGLTTDDFANVVQSMTEFAKVIATLPDYGRPPVLSSEAGKALRSELAGLKPEDRSVPPPVSAKKRKILSTIGFAERTYNLTGTTASLADSAAAKPFRQALANLRDYLVSLLQGL